MSEFKVVIKNGNNKKCYRVKESDVNKNDFFSSLGLEKISEILPIYKTHDDLLDHCSICHENYNSELVRVLDCGHIFHKKCIKKWIKNNPSCPNCREDVLVS